MARRSGGSGRAAVLSIMVGLLAVVLVAGCGSSAKPSRTTAGVQPAPDACSAAIVPTAASTRASSARTATIELGGLPFGVASTPDGHWSFVAEEAATSRIAVFSDRSFSPRLVRTISVPGRAVGVGLADDGRYLLIANGDGATVVSVTRAEAGAPHPVLGVLHEPASAGRGGEGAIEVTSSQDGHLAFVSLEGSARLAVYDLRAALADDFRGADYVGSVPVHQSPVGMAISPDGRWLYATSEVAKMSAQPGLGYRGTHGTLSVISVATAGRNPAAAVVATVSAHCSPVRVALSPDGGTVWVTARGDNQLLAFSAARLRSDRSHALLAAVRVGEAPVGLAVVGGGREIVVADSNRFNSVGGHASLTVVDAAAALAHRPAILGTVAAGSFPREMSLEPDRPTLLVGDYGSRQLEAVNLSALP
jgi:DNA-binding beta-propeller fold protein YncE